MDHSVPEKAPADVSRPASLEPATSVWRSRISWRITLTVFATLLLVQTCVLVVTMRNVRADLLGNLSAVSRAAIAASLEHTKEPNVSPLKREAAQKLFLRTELRGATVFGLDYGQIETFGAATSLTPQAAVSRGIWTADETGLHEVMFTPSDLGQPYYIAARLDAQAADTAVDQYLKQNLVIFMLLSGFVTSILMLVLGQWLLEPIMLLRGNLLSAARQPERPELRNLPQENRDEVGVAVKIANDLIRQNASNLKRLRAQAEDKIHRLAYYDSLTGLPNRTFFIEKLEEAIRLRVAAEDRQLAVFSIDLDHFKDINDSMGHEIGDKLLEAIGRRLSKALPPDAVTARASADEFVALVVLSADHPDSQGIVQRIFAAMAEPVSIAQERFQVRVSVGVAQCPDDGMDARQIMKNADIALNRAKQEGRDTARYYSQDFDRAVQARFQMLRNLRTALDEDQLRLYYHPQFDLKTGALIGAEALLRWWRPDNSKEGGAFISPAEFVPVAEQSGLIVPLGEWVLRTACRQNREWQDRGVPPFRVAVNISGVQFHRADIVSLTGEVLRETGLNPQYLELEITESVFMENTEMAIDILDKLHGLGVEIAVDDFGTGYSSLSYLRRFPIDRIKIDQSFTRNALVDADDATIARTIISLGHSLGLKVIAEGVETVEHESFLRREGCDEAQGFKYTKPIPADQFMDFAVAHHRALAQATRLTAIDSAGPNVQ